MQPFKSGVDELAKPLRERLVVVQTYVYRFENPISKINDTDEKRVYNILVVWVVSVVKIILFSWYSDIIIYFTCPIEQ